MESNLVYFEKKKKITMVSGKILMEVEELCGF